MALSRVKTWTAEVLTASDLNAEFNNIINNALSLISPLTGTLDLDNNRLDDIHAGSVSDTSLNPNGDGNTGIYFPAADQAAWAVGGNQAVLYTTSKAHFNDEGDDMDHIVEGDTNTTLFNLDGGQDAISFGGANVDGAAAVFNNLTDRTAVTSVGAQIHVPAQTQNFDNGSGTIAIGAAAFIGIPTWTGDTATLTVTDLATLYIQGAPVDSTNVTGTNKYALIVDGGASRLDGPLYILEQADADGDRAAYGQLWVNTATPNELYFTDDAGTDFQLGVVGGASGIQLNDSVNLSLGTGSDATLYYDGTDMFINPAAVGTGELVVLAEMVVNADGQTLATPDGTLHVYTASAGGITADAGADDLVVESSGSTGITILSGTSSNSTINFGDSGDADRGSLFYDHHNNKMFMIVSANVMAHISNGVFEIEPSSNSGDTELEVSDGVTTGAGAVHRASSGAHSMRHMKTEIKKYGAADDLAAYEGIKSLKPIRFRYRKGADPHNPLVVGEDDPTMPEHNGYNFDEVPDLIKDPNTETITIDDRIMMCEMALKEVIRKVETPGP